MDRASQKSDLSDGSGATYFSEAEQLLASPVITTKRRAPESRDLSAKKHKKRENDVVDSGPLESSAEPVEGQGTDDSKSKSQPKCECRPMLLLESINSEVKAIGQLVKTLVEKIN